MARMAVLPQPRTPPLRSATHRDPPRPTLCAPPLVPHPLRPTHCAPPLSRPEAMADDQAERCVAPGGLAICLGTSMQMTPARDWPCKADKMVIVNLQPTVRDDKAALVIRAPIDDVLLGVMLGFRNFTAQI